MRLLFSATPAGDMFKDKIDEIFKELLNIFGIANDISIVGYDAYGKDNSKMLR